VDENRLCKRCRQVDEEGIPGQIKLIHHKGHLRLEAAGSGYVLSKEDWYRIKRRVDAFYTSVTSEDIDWLNTEKRKERDQRDRVMSGYIYLMQADNGYHKIGRTINLETRNKNLMREYPLEIKIVHSFFCRNCVKAEKRLLGMFSEKRLQGEWFSLEQQDIEFITSITDEIAQTLF